jgi:profilin
MTTLWRAFTDQNVLPGSLRFGGQKYMLIAGDPGSVIRGKLSQSGIVVKKTNTAMVFGIFDEGVQPGDCNVVVENLGDYLIGQGI